MNEHVQFILETHAYFAYEQVCILITTIIQVLLVVSMSHKNNLENISGEKILQVFNGLFSSYRFHVYEETSGWIDHCDDDQHHDGFVMRISTTRQKDGIIIFTHRMRNCVEYLLLVLLFHVFISNIYKNFIIIIIVNGLFNI